MKCINCGKEIKNELNSKLVNIDGDFVCNKECEKKYLNDRYEFFKNISNDKWYEKNYFKL